MKTVNKWIPLVACTLTLALLGCKSSTQQSAQQTPHNPLLIGLPRIRPAGTNKRRQMQINRLRRPRQSPQRPERNRSRSPRGPVWKSAW